MSTLVGYNEQGFIEMPATGWLHEDRDLIDGNSITYSISYVGMVPVFESINGWKQDLRTELVREAIVRLADHAQLLTANKKRKVTKKVQKALGAPSKQWGCECKLAISVDDFTIKNGVNNREMFKHQLNSISFASGGEGVTIDFVAYVGKDSRSGRGCHIFECPRKSHLVLLTMGQAFDLSYRRFKAKKAQPISVNQRGDNWGPGTPSAGTYEEFTRSNNRSMMPSGQGIYDNSFGKGSANDYEPFPRRNGLDSDMYGTTRGPQEDIYDNGRGGQKMKNSEDGIYDNGMGKNDGIYDNRPGNAAEYMTSTEGGVGSEYEVSHSNSKKVFDDPTYESVKGRDGIKYTQDGIYDNGPAGRQDGVYDNTPGQRRPGGKKGDGMEEDIYGGVGGVDEGVYDTAGGVKKGMKYSEEGLYDNPHAGEGQNGVYDNTPSQRRPGGKKGDGMEEDIYGGVGGGNEGVYDTAGGVKKGMKYSEEGLYDNPHAGEGQDGVYSNTPGQTRPGGKKGDGMEEDIYGGVGGGNEGVYDTAGGVKKGMKYSEEGLYDNPHEQGEESVYDNVKMKRKVDGAVRIAKKDTIDEDIYGSTDGGEVEGFYDDPKSVHHKGMKLSEEGIYDNPTGVKGPDDNEYEDIPDENGLEEGIYGGTPGDLGNDIYDNPQVVGGVKSPTMKFSGEGIYDNPESMTNEDPIYDNEAGTVVQPENRLRKPRRMAEFDQSIYSKVPGKKNEGQRGPKEKWPLIHQPWFHGKMERIEAEAMLEKNGDFLVRESSKKPGQYVLTAIAMNKPQHLLLVDSTGKVKAKDREFSSVGELIYHFMEKGLPLYMDKTEVVLKTPIVNSFPPDDIDQDNAIYQETGAS